MNNSNLPGGWKAVFDKAAGHTYYVDKVTQETSWTKPTAPTASYLAGYPMPLSNANAAWANAEQKRLIKKGQQMKNAELAAEAPAREAAKEAARQKYEAEMAVQREEARVRAEQNNAEENASDKIAYEKLMKAVKDRYTKPITRVITNTMSTYLKGKFRLGEISDILASLDKQGINKNTPNYSNYAKQYLELNKVLFIIKDKFNKYVNIGRSYEYNGIFIGGFSSTPLLEALYNAEISVSLKDEKYEIPVNHMYNLHWQGIDDEELEKIKNNKKYKHTDFQIINIIPRYMGYSQILDAFRVRFPTKENADKEPEDFNMLLPQFMETKARVLALEKNFIREYKYPHILDIIYEIEFSQMLPIDLKDILEAEEAAVKEAKKSIVKPLGHNIVRENQNNAFGGTRRSRRNRKSTRRNRKSTRRNRRN